MLVFGRGLGSDLWVVLAVGVVDGGDLVGLICRLSWGVGALVSAGCSDGDAGGAQRGEDGVGGAAVEAAEAGGAGTFPIELRALGHVESGLDPAGFLPPPVVRPAQAARVVALLAAWDAAPARIRWGGGVDIAGAPPPGVVRRAVPQGVMGLVAALDGAQGGPWSASGDFGGSWGTGA